MALDGIATLLTSGGVGLVSAMVSRVDQIGVYGVLQRINRREWSTAQRMHPRDRSLTMLVS